MPAPTPYKQPITQPKTRGPYDGSGWKTFLFNCYCHSVEEVEVQVMKALNCSSTTARSLTNIAHHTGQVKVCEGSEEYCESVADVLGSIGLNVKVVE